MGMEVNSVKKWIVSRLTSCSRISNYFLDCLHTNANGLMSELLSNYKIVTK